MNYLFFITLQEKIDTVTVEGDENVEEEDCIEIKTEVSADSKGEQELGVLFSK